jgi:hypothetical protein
MDVLVDLLLKFGFKRLSSRLTTPIVVHCVPGAGKSTLIRELLDLDTRFYAYTAGVPDSPRLNGRWIRALEEYPGTEGQLVIVDEYTLLDKLPFEPFAVFGDPIQSNSKGVLPAHFTCNFSRRFGLATSNLLRDLGWDVIAEGSDVVQISDIFGVEPIGTVVYFEAEVGCLLRSHCVEAKSLAEIRGQTFDIVTFVTSENCPSSDVCAAFQCLTRHREALHILCPNATYTTA